MVVDKWDGHQELNLKRENVHWVTSWYLLHSTWYESSCSGALIVIIIFTSGTSFLAPTFHSFNQDKRWPIIGSLNSNIFGTITWDISHRIVFSWQESDFAYHSLFFELVSETLWHALSAVPFGIFSSKALFWSSTWQCPVDNCNDYYYDYGSEQEKNTANTAI